MVTGHAGWRTVSTRPGGRRSTRWPTCAIRRIQSHGRDVEASGPGTRTALNLADVDPVAGVHRGDVITLPEMGGASDCLDVMLEISARAGRPLKDGVRVRVHYGSGNVPAHVALGAGKELAVGQRQLRAVASRGAGVPVRRRPSHAARLVRAADAGWSVVLDPDATRRAFRHEATAVARAPRCVARRTPAEFVAAYVARDRAVRPSHAFVKTRFSKQDID